MKNITIYSKYNCPYCVRAKMLLDSKGVEYTVVNIEDEPDRREEMLERSNGGRTFPQILIGETHVGGCDDLYALEASGKLEQLLKVEKKQEIKDHRKVAIIGSGPAGYTAGIYSGRANLNPILFTGKEKGGQLTTTTDIENFPGFPLGIDGVELMESMEKQTKRFGTDIVYGEVKDIDLSKRPFTIYVGKDIYTSDTIIISTGATARYLGLPSEEKYRGRGVSACATCDGFFFKEKEVAVVGGGDTAMEEASYLANICSKVYLIHRREEFRASKAMQDRVKRNEKIEIIYNSVVDEVLGDGKDVNALRLKDTKGETLREIDIEALFVAIGHTPNTKFLNNQLPVDENGYLLVEGSTSKTSIEGVFASGDVIDPHYRQAITAAGSGCKAALDAERWLEAQE